MHMLRSESLKLNPPPTETDKFFRKISALALIIFLYSTATPFSPVSWVVQAKGGFLLDRIFAGILLFSALYFQWRIACQTSGWSMVRTELYIGTEINRPALSWPNSSGVAWL